MNNIAKYGLVAAGVYVLYRVFGKTVGLSGLSGPHDHHRGAAFHDRWDRAYGTGNPYFADVPARIRDDSGQRL